METVRGPQGPVDPINLCRGFWRPGDRKTLALALLWRLHGFLKTKLGVGAVAVCLSKLDGLYGR